MVGRAKAASTAKPAAETETATDITSPEASAIATDAAATEASAADAVQEPGSPDANTDAAPQEATESNTAVTDPDAASLPERLEVLGLDLGSDDMVALTMLTSMEGPEISLARFDPHRCDPEEAIRLVLARFAKPA